MIDSLDDLVRYSEEVAKASPLISKKVQIVRPGCQPEVVAALRQLLPGLPESYLSVAESIAIDGIVIGYFNLTPGLPRARITEKLRVSNDPVMAPMAERFRQHGVYQVASWEADPICVTHTAGMFEIGQLVMYNVGMPAEPPVVLADSFEQLLLIAGNLQEIGDKYDEPARALGEFRAYLAPLVAGRKDDMESTWTQIAGVVLGK